MEVYKVVGMRTVNFKGTDGNQINGTNLFCTYEDCNVEGLATEKFFIPMQKFMKMSFIPKVGSSCEIIFNRYGKIADIAKV